jgi:uncharacterized protein (DUF934 family)
MNTINLIANNPHPTCEKVLISLNISNDSDLSALSQEISNAEQIQLHFPSFHDGRAFSQAVQLRKRLGFKGDIRATGDVLVDQVVQMQRSGFSSAVLREDQSIEHAQKLLTHFTDFYQGDVASKAAFLTGKLA